MFTQNSRCRKCLKRHSQQGISSNIMVKCQAVNCTTRARYGKVRRKPLFCKPHRAEGDWNVSQQPCESERCFKQPTFGLVRGKPLSCGEHKEDGYVEVRRKTCESEGCPKQRTFGLVRGKPLSCGEHKKDGYSNVVSPKCESDGCLKEASFGLVRGKRLSCAEHKKDGYSNDVLKCESDGCSKVPTFGTEWNKPLSCRAHKRDCYTNVTNKTCESYGCLKQRNFGLVWGKPLACRGHGQEGYVDVTRKRCGSSACILLPMIERGHGRSKVEGLLLCGNCLRSLYPDLAKRFKVRTEHFVLAELQRRMPELEDNFLSWDCPLPCAISTERADMLWEVGSTLLHVEVDETATHEDDRNRLMRLLAGTDAVDHIVVRIHTHSFQNFKPCVTKSQINGEWVVACRKKEFDRRMDLVVPEIRRLLAARESVVKVMFSNH